MPTTQQLREQRANIWEQMKAVNDGAEGRVWTSEETQTYDRLEAEYDGLTDTIERAERHEKRAAANSHVDRRGVVEPEGTGDVDQKFRPLIRQLSQGAVPRDQFELAFNGISPDLTDLKLVAIRNARVAERPAKPVQHDDLSLTSDKDSYSLGDTPVFTIVAPRDCYLTLTDIDERGEGTVLFPNSFQQDNLVRAGVPVRFPGGNAPFQFRMKDKGIETVTAVCAVQAGGGDRIQHDFKKNQFTPVPNYTTALARSILVEAVRPGTPTVAGSTNAGAAAVAAREPPPSGSRGSFRAAIKLRVR